MNRRGQTRYGHAFSKGKVGFHSQGSWRQQKAAMIAYPIKLDPARWKLLKISPTVATIYKGNLGLAVVCASCHSGRAYRNPGLPDYFKRQWHLTLMEVEKKCRCEHCGKRDARVYPWLDNDGADLGLEGPPASP